MVGLGEWWDYTDGRLRTEDGLRGVRRHATVRCFDSEKTRTDAVGAWYWGVGDWTGYDASWVCLFSWDQLGGRIGLM